MPRAQHESISLPIAVAKKLRDVSKVTRVPKTQILLQLVDQHLDAWHREFFEKNPAEPR